MGSGFQDYTWLSDPDSINERIRSVSCLRKNNQIRIPEAFRKRQPYPSAGMIENKPEMDTGTGFGYGHRNSPEICAIRPFLVVRRSPGYFPLKKTSDRIASKLQKVSRELHHFFFILDFVLYFLFWMSSILSFISDVDLDDTVDEHFTFNSIEYTLSHNDRPR